MTSGSEPEGHLRKLHPQKCRVPGRSLRIAVLVKQVPVADELRLGPDGRLVRESVTLELNPHCRRAVAQACLLASEHGGAVTAITLGAPAAAEILREAVAWGADDGILVSDPAFAGSDTYATASALYAALGATGEYDLVLLGRSSIDSDTGQVGPAVAELLGWPFLHSVRKVVFQGRQLRVESQLDDGALTAVADLPAVASCAERLCEPAKIGAEERRRVDESRIRVVAAADLGTGPWGSTGSLTTVGASRPTASGRQGLILSGSVLSQVVRATVELVDRRALGWDGDVLTATVDKPRETGHLIAVVAEPELDGVTRELLGEAARLGGPVVCLDAAGLPDRELSTWGADAIVDLTSGSRPDEVATTAAAWSEGAGPWAVLVPGTAWGREMAARMATRTRSGLTGDAVELEVSDGRLIGWKSAFSGGLVVAVTATSPIQMVTVRPGVLGSRSPRRPRAITRTACAPVRRSLVTVTSNIRDDDVAALDRARTVVGVGMGVPATSYGHLRPLLAALGAELAATRKVTDRGWLPHARQVGITGRAIAPRLYVAIGLSGKFNHMAGVQRAGTVLAVNADPSARVFGSADIGIVGDWEEVVPLLAASIEHLGTRPAATRSPT